MTAVRTSARTFLAFAVALAFVIAVALMGFAASTGVDRAPSTWNVHPKADSSTWNESTPTTLAASSTWNESSTWN